MLTTDHVTIKFGGLIAVNQVSVHIKPAEITGLIGPNGAGKTTFFNCISGVYKPNNGTVVFNGQHIEGWKPYRVNQIGISRTYQVINLFRKMSVIENVLVGMHPRLKSSFLTDMLRTPAQRKEERGAYEKAYEWLKFVNLQDFMSSPAGSLAYGQQRLLEIVRSLASSPKLILLDEPAAGMNSKEKEELDELFKRILDLGVTILMVEHDMKLVMNVCDYIYVLSEGKLLANGTPDEVQNNQDVITAYLGGD